MTNTTMLKYEMAKKSITSKELAVLLDISDNSFSRKLNNDNEFKASEIRLISSKLELSDGQTRSIFLDSM